MDEVLPKHSADQVNIPSAADLDLINVFLDSSWMEKGLSRHTQESYRRDLSQFDFG